MSKILLIGEYPTYADLNNRGSYTLVHKIMKEVLTDNEGKPFEYEFGWMIQKPFSSDTKYKVSDKEFKEAFDVNHVIELVEECKPEKIMIFGLRALKYFTKAKTLNSVINTVCDCSIEGIDVPIYANYSPNLLANHYDDYINAFLNRFDSVFNHIEVKINTDYKVCMTVSDVREVIEMIKESGICCFDFETTGFEYYDPGILTTLLSLSFNCGYSYIIPTDHFESPFSVKEMDLIWSLLAKGIFENPDVIKIAHNLKFDLHFIYRFCTKKLRGEYHDTMLMHHILDENGKHGLKELTKIYFPAYAGYEVKIDFINSPLADLALYAAIDTDLTLRLFINFESQLINDDKKSRLYVLYRNYAIPATMEILKAEHHGAKIDRKYLLESIEYADSVASQFEFKLRNFKEVKKFQKLKAKEINDAKIAEYEEKLKKAKPAYVNRCQQKIEDLKFGPQEPYELNLMSNKQMNELFYLSDVGFKFPLFFDQWKNEHKMSMSGDYIKTLKHDFIDMLLAYKTVNKMVSTYYKGILKRIDDDDYLHASFLVHGTVTGRLSCVAEGTLINTNKGLIKIEDLCPNEYGEKEVKGLYALTHKNRYRPITKGINKGVEMMYELELENGKKIKCTENHKILTNKGWYSLKFILSLQFEEYNKLQIISYG